jgi:hypothetical protein
MPSEFTGAVDSSISEISDFAIVLMAWFCSANRHDVAFSMINLAA